MKTTLFILATTLTTAAAGPVSVRLHKESSYELQQGTNHIIVDNISWNLPNAVWKNKQGTCLSLYCYVHPSNGKTKPVAMQYIENPNQNHLRIPINYSSGHTITNTGPCEVTLVFHDTTTPKLGEAGKNYGVVAEGKLNITIPPATKTKN